MKFSYEKTSSLPEAMALYAEKGGRHPVLAGGTDLIVQWRSGARKVTGFVDIGSVDELHGIKDCGDGIEIGALSTHADIMANKLISKYFPALADACRSIGAVQIRNRGTIGGNIMNGSPAADCPPVIMVLGAELLAQNILGERWIHIDNLFTGYRTTSFTKDELLTKIKIPKLASGEIVKFYKVGTRKAQSISKAVMCVRAKIVHGGIEDIAIAIGSVAPTVIRAKGTEALLRGHVITSALIDQAILSLEDEVQPIDDVRSTAEYRKFVCGSLIGKFLKEV